MQIDKAYLKSKFLEYNRLYFNSELKTPIFTLIDSPNLAGQYCARWGRRNGVMQLICNEIQIEQKVLWTEQTLRSVLVHEMIHYYVETKKTKPCRNGDFQHWGLFWRIKVRLNWKYGLKIRNRDTDLPMKEV